MSLVSHSRESGNPVISNYYGLPLEFIPHLMRGGSDVFLTFYEVVNVRGIMILCQAKLA